MKINQNSSIGDRMQQLKEKMWEYHRDLFVQLEETKDNTIRMIREEPLKISISDATVRAFFRDKNGDGSSVAEAIKLVDGIKTATLEMKSSDARIEEDVPDIYKYGVAFATEKTEEADEAQIVSGGDGWRAMISGSLKCQDEDYQHIDVGCCCGGWKDRDTEVVCPLVMKMFRWVYDGGGDRQCSQPYQMKDEPEA